MIHLKVILSDSKFYIRSLKLSRFQSNKYVYIANNNRYLFILLFNCMCMSRIIEETSTTTMKWCIHIFVDVVIKKTKMCDKTQNYKKQFMEFTYFIHIWVHILRDGHARTNVPVIGHRTKQGNIATIQVLQYFWYSEES